MDAEYFVSINEVAKRLNVPAHTLRYWEKQFPVAIRPTTGAGGRRYYRGETVAKLETIKSLLYDRGMTIAGVKKLIHDGELPKSPDEFVVKPAKQTQPKQNTNAFQPMPADITNEVETVISLLNTAREILSAV